MAVRDYTRRLLVLLGALSLVAFLENLLPLPERLVALIDHFRAVSRPVAGAAYGWLLGLVWNSAPSWILDYLWTGLVSAATIVFLFFATQAYHDRRDSIGAAQGGAIALVAFPYLYLMGFRLFADAKITENPRLQARRLWIARTFIDPLLNAVLLLILAVPIFLIIQIFV